MFKRYILKYIYRGNNMFSWIYFKIILIRRQGRRWGLDEIRFVVTEIWCEIHMGFIVLYSLLL